MISIELSDENERFIDEELAQGTYQTRDELLNEALEQLRNCRNLMHRIEEGAQQLKDGEYLVVDQGGLKSFFDDLKARGRERASTRKPRS